MPRREIPFVPDQYYHFYNRGNNRQVVFMERENYVYFLKGIKALPAWTGGGDCVLPDANALSSFGKGGG